MSNLFEQRVTYSQTKKIDLENVRSQFFERVWAEKQAVEILSDKNKARRILRDIVSENNMPLSVIETLMENIYGWGVISDLMEDPEVTNIWINRYDCIYYEKGGKIYDFEKRFSSENELRYFAIRLASSSGRKLDETHCIEDFKLSDGSRVVAVLPPVSVRGTTLTIRKFASLLTLEELSEKGSFPKELIPMLRLFVKARLNIFTAGGMGSGKNTLLNAMLLSVGKDENLIFVEDPAETKVGLPDVNKNIPVPKVRVFEPRRSGIEGTGEVDLNLIFEKCMRMQPTRLICSECRDPITTYWTLQAMNIGHPGSMSSIHCEGVDEVVLRLSDLLAAYPGGAYSQISARIGKISAAEIIIFLGQINGYRRVLDIAEIQRTSDNELPDIVSLYSFNLEGFKETGEPIGKLLPTGNKPMFLNKRKISLFLNRSEINELKSFFEEKV
ncbi:MAG: Pilus assembly protein CpaF [Thermoanaerobacterium thermosaccharolyticum]|jgi:pilus assembly protein CpaF